MNSPHLLLRGDGATRFARTLSMPDYDPTTQDSLRRSRERQAVLLGADVPPDWKGFDWRARWNFEAPLPDALRADRGAHDTVGVAVRSADGRFAAALSTGGLSLAMRGRVGDVPVLGAGLYAGGSGAVAATGTGERIVEAGLARQVHGLLASGSSNRDPRPLAPGPAPRATSTRAMHPTAPFPVLVTFPVHWGEMGPLAKGDYTTCH